MAIVNSYVTNYRRLNPIKSHSTIIFPWFSPCFPHFHRVFPRTTFSRDEFQRCLRCSVVLASGSLILGWEVDQSTNRWRWRWRCFDKPIIIELFIIIYPIINNPIINHYGDYNHPSLWRLPIINGLIDKPGKPIGKWWFNGSLMGFERIYQWVDKKGKILTGNQPDFPMKIMGCSCHFSRKNQSIEDGDGDVWMGKWAIKPIIPMI